MTDLPSPRPSGGALAARWVPLLLALVALPLAAPTAGAQLRPFNAVDWELLDSGRQVSASLGVEAYTGQRASLAGTEGNLWELGSFQASWRTGRVLLELSGTALRRFEDRHAFAPPHGGAEPADGAWRSDAGDVRVSTAVLLTPSDAPARAVLRFGSRLPTTDNKVGLERDRIDFFALVGAHAARGPWFAAGETGVGINGTREPDFEQSDVLVFLASAGYRGPDLGATLALAGHADGMPGRAVRGSEELAELRFGLRAGKHRRVWAEAVRGLTEFSPELGVRLGVAFQM